MGHPVANGVLVNKDMSSLISWGPDWSEAREAYQQTNGCVTKNWLTNRARHTSAEELFSASADQAERLLTEVTQRDEIDQERSLNSVD